MTEKKETKPVVVRDEVLRQRIVEMADNIRSRVDAALAPYSNPNSSNFRAAPSDLSIKVDVFNVIEWELRNLVRD